MEDEKELSKMSIYELADMLISNPEMADEIFQVISLEEKDMDEFYNAVKSNILPNEVITEDYDIEYNESVQKALELIAEHCGYASISAYEFDEDSRETQKRHYEEIRDFQNRLDDEIAYGATPDELREYCEMYGYKLEEWYDMDTLQEKYKHYGYEYNPEDNSMSKIVKEKQPQNQAFLDWLEGGDKKTTPLQQKETELSSLEVEAKTISEAEALIDRQNECHNIGE